MDRLFLDANVLFSAAYKIDARLRRLWKIRNVALCSSRYALEEARINLATEDQRSRLTELSGSLHLFEAGQTPLPLGILLPEKDAPIFLAAIEAQATHLLTGDVRHFRAYFGRKIEGIAIMRPVEYLKEPRRKASTLPMI
jgi:predicted nucleic acid-binding protein